MEICPRINLLHPTLIEFSFNFFLAMFHLGKVRFKVTTAWRLENHNKIVKNTLSSRREVAAEIAGNLLWKRAFRAVFTGVSKKYLFRATFSTSQNQGQTTRDFYARLTQVAGCVYICFQLWLVKDCQLSSWLARVMCFFGLATLPWKSFAHVSSLAGRGCGRDKRWGLFAVPVKRPLETRVIRVDAL